MQMVQDIFADDVKSITDKNLRVRAVSRRNVVRVHPNIDMKLVGHTSTEGYICYNTKDEGIEMRAL